MYQLKDFRTKLEELHTEVHAHVDGYAAANRLLADDGKRLTAIYEHELSKEKPEIMVYGIYNAGKSSIINELLGEDRAKVADVPTTDRVDLYEWNGYRIADTPGVGAPIQHEKVTQEHLKNADVVLFVMSTTGSNERSQNYVRMKDIADAGKKIIIVLNDKDGKSGTTDEAARELQEIKRKVAQNMKQVGIANVEEKYVIVVVDAKRARRGRLETNEKKKQVFLDKSNIAELANVIMQELKRTNAFDVLGRSIYNIERVLDDMIAHLGAMANDAQAKPVQEVLDGLRRRRQSIQEEMNVYIERKAERMGYQLPDLIFSHKGSQEEVQSVVTEQVAAVADAVQRELTRKLRELTEDLMQDVREAQVKIAAPQVDASDLAASLGKLPDGDGAVEEGAFDAGEVMKDIGDVLEKVKANLPPIPEKITSKTLGNMLSGTATGQVADAIVKSAVKTSIGKAVMGTAVGKFLAPIVPVVGPAISVITIAWPILKGIFGKDDSEDIQRQVDALNAQARAQEEARQQVRQELTQKCRYMAAELSDTFKEAVGMALQDYGEAIAAPVKAQAEKMEGAAKELQADLMALQDLGNQYEALRTSITQAQPA